MVQNKPACTLPRKNYQLNSIEKTPPSDKPRFFYGWYLVAASWLMMVLWPAVAVSIFFKPILEEFGWDRATLSLVSAVGLIVFAVTSPFLGRIIDRWGPRAMLFICVANGLATSLWHLYMGRFLYEIKVMHSTQVLVNRSVC